MGENGPDYGYKGEGLGTQTVLTWVMSGYAYILGFFWKEQCDKISVGHNEFKVSAGHPSENV